MGAGKLILRGYKCFLKIVLFPKKKCSDTDLPFCELTEHVKHSSYRRQAGLVKLELGNGDHETL